MILALYDRSHQSYSVPIQSWKVFQRPHSDHPHRDYVNVSLMNRRYFATPDWIKDANYFILDARDQNEDNYFQGHFTGVEVYDRTISGMRVLNIVFTGFEFLPIKPIPKIKKLNMSWKKVGF